MLSVSQAGRACQDSEGGSIRCFSDPTSANLPNSCPGVYQECLPFLAGQLQQLSGRSADAGRHDVHAMHGAGAAPPQQMPIRAPEHRRPSLPGCELQPAVLLSVYGLGPSPGCVILPAWSVALASRWGMRKATLSGHPITPPRSIASPTGAACVVAAGSGCVGSLWVPMFTAQTLCVEFHRASLPNISWAACSC